MKQVERSRELQQPELRGNGLCCFVHFMRRNKCHITLQAAELVGEGARPRGRLKFRCQNKINADLKKAVAQIGETQDSVKQEVKR